jgi:hypothetical protein
MNFVLVNNAKTNMRKAKINPNHRKNGESKGLLVVNLLDK